MILSLFKKYSPIKVQAIATVTLAVIITAVIASITLTVQRSAALANVSSLPFTKLDSVGDSIALDTQDHLKPNYQGLVASGGMHTQAINPGTPATTVAAKNLVVISQATGKVVYGGNVGGIVRDVRFCDNTKLYIAGDFLTVNGITQKYLAKFNYNGNTFTYDSTWKPVSPGRVRSIDCSSDRVFFTGETQGVYAVNTTNGAAIAGWANSSRGFLSFGPRQGRALEVVGDSLYIGGNFSAISGFITPGLGKVSVTSGLVDTTFTPTSIIPSDIYGKGGETIVSMDVDPLHNQLVVGGAGTERNALRALDLNTGFQNWGYDNLYGDTQAVAVVPYGTDRTVVFMGFHWNKTKNPVTPTKPGVCNYHAAFDLAGPQGSNLIAGSDNMCASWWDPKFEGAVPNNPSGGNGGIQSLIYDPATDRLVYGGAFRKVNGLAQAGLATFNRPTLPLQ